MRALVIIGGTVLALGALFFLQGMSAVGPESSFMYSDPDWTNYGALLAAAGIAVIIVGLRR